MVRMAHRVLLWLLPADGRIIHALYNRYEYVVPIWRAYAVSPGTLYARLARMERMGVVCSGVDDTPPPRRRHYRLTGKGHALARSMVDYPSWQLMTQLTNDPKGAE